MIRFIDLRGQDTDGRFAFYNTVSAEFVQADDGSQVWDTLYELQQAGTWRYAEFERFRSLAPAWTGTSEKELDDAPCILCELLDADHLGECKTRSALVAWLAGTA